MTNLQKLLAEHPAPWEHDGSSQILDADGNLVLDLWDDANVGIDMDTATFCEIAASIVNDYAARVAAGERFISGGGDG